MRFVFLLFFVLVVLAVTTVDEKRSAVNEQLQDAEALFAASGKFPADNATIVIFRGFEQDGTNRYPGLSTGTVNVDNFGDFRAESRRKRRRLIKSPPINDLHAPIPYAYGYGAIDEDGHHSHKEISDGLRARGAFTQTLADGRTRTTEYVADEKGFRVLAIRDTYLDSNLIPTPKPTVKPVKDEKRLRWNPTRIRNTDT